MMHDPNPDEPDEFIARLRAQPPAKLPAHWRTEILAAAGVVRPSAWPSRWRRAADALGAWLWPHPLAYAGLATAWVFILAMRLVTIAPPPTSSSIAAGLVTNGERTGPENGLPIFESIRLASRESSWDPTVTDHP